MSRLLFDDISIDKAFANQRRKVAAQIAQLPPDEMLMHGVDDLERELVDAFRIDALVLHWDRATAEPRQVEIELGSSLTRGGPDDEGASPSATEIAEFIPFSGAAGLFDMRPSTHNAHPPRGLVRERELEISYVGVNPDAPTVEAELGGHRANLEAWVSAINRDVEVLTADLRRAARAALKARLKTLRAGEEVVSALGVPRRQRPAAGRGGRLDEGGRKAVVAPDGVVSAPRRGPGRPSWDRAVFEDHWREALFATPHPQTSKALARHFRALDGTVGVSSDHLGRLRARYPE